MALVVGKSVNTMLICSHGSDISGKISQAKSPLSIVISVATYEAQLTKKPFKTKQLSVGPYCKLM